jgi:hypothetical protein
VIGQRSLHASLSRRLGSLVVLLNLMAVVVAIKNQTNGKFRTCGSISWNSASQRDPQNGFEMVPNPIFLTPWLLLFSGIVSAHVKDGYRCILIPVFESESVLRANYGTLHT